MKTNLWLTVLTIALVLNMFMMRHEVEGDACSSGIRKEHLDTTPGNFVDDETIEIGANGLQVKAIVPAQVDSIFGTRQTGLAADTVYQAGADGFLTVCMNGGLADEITVYSDSSNPPTTEIGYLKNPGSYVTFGVSGVFPVKKNDYVKATTANGATIDYMHFLPVGTGTLTTP